MGGGIQGGGGGGGGGGTDFLAQLQGMKGGRGEATIEALKSAGLMTPNPTIENVATGMMGPDAYKLDKGFAEFLGGFNTPAPEPEEEGLNEPLPVNPNAGMTVSNHRPTLMPKIEPSSPGPVITPGAPVQMPQYGRRLVK